MGWTHLRDETPRARKAYRCIICGEVIEAGLKHTARTGIDDNGPVTFRMHLECDELAFEWTQDDWECHYPGDVERPKAKAEVPA